MTDSHAHPLQQAEQAGSQRPDFQRADRWESRLLIVLCLTLVYMLAEVGGGLYTHSLALVADAGHMFTDAFGLGMALLAVRFTQRPATPGRTFGFYRAEVLAALVNSLLLLAVSAYILFEAYLRLREPVHVSAGPMALVACGGLAVTIVGVRLLHDGSDENLNRRAAFLEVLSDLLGAAGTILAAVVLLLTGWPYADSLVSVVIGLLILPRAAALFKSVLDVLLEAVPPALKVEDIHEAILNVPGVASIHDLHIWSITNGYLLMSAHVEARSRSSEDVLHDVQSVLRERFSIEHATLQVEQADHAADGACCVADPRCLVVRPRTPPLLPARRR